MNLPLNCGDYEYFGALRRLPLEKVFEEGIYFLHIQWIFPIYTKETELFFC